MYLLLLHCYSFGRLPNKYLYVDPEAHFVNHISVYEHSNAEKYGFEAAKTKVLSLSEAAVRGECQLDHLQRGAVPHRRNSISVIPFYGGLPPNGTKHESDSLGQGNSRVDPTTKALQALATVCSTLRYFGFAFVGTMRAEDTQVFLHVVRFSSPNNHNMLLYY